MPVVRSPTPPILLWIEDGAVIATLEIRWGKKRTGVGRTSIQSTLKKKERDVEEETRDITISLVDKQFQLFLACHHYQKLYACHLNS